MTILILKMGYFHRTLPIVTGEMVSETGQHHHYHQPHYRVSISAVLIRGVVPVD